MATEHRQIIFGLTALVGVAATWYWNLQFMAGYGEFSVLAFVADAYANPAAASISSDILVVTFAFLFWSLLEARRLGMKHWWVYLLLTFGIAMAFAFPLFLLMRERRLAAMHIAA